MQFLNTSTGFRKIYCFIALRNLSRVLDGLRLLFYHCKRIVISKFMHVARFPTSVDVLLIHETWFCFQGSFMILKLPFYGLRQIYVKKISQENIGIYIGEVS